MFNAPSIDVWRFLEIAGVWAAAGSTYYAARMALYIARRQDEILMRMFADAGLWFDGYGKSEEVVLFKIINVGRRPVTINSVGWKLSRLSKVALYQKVDDGRGDKLPKTLGDGGEVSIAIPVELSGRSNWYRMFAEAFRGHGRLRRWIEIRSLRFCVHLSTGERRCVRPTKDFVKRLRKAVASLESDEIRS